MINIAGNPYFDDFSPLDRYLKVLFKSPKVPVQTRELNQIASILQHQLSTFAEHVFSHGSPVFGGQISYTRNVYAKLEATFGGSPVVMSQWEGMVIEEKDNSDQPTGVKAKVIAVRDIEGSDPKTLYFHYTAGKTFTAGNKLYVEGTGIGATIQSGGLGYATQAGIQDGIFFINGYMVPIESQLIILDKYSSQPTGVVGIYWDEKIITAEDEQKLLDNAAGSPNYAGAGADRLRMELDLRFVDNNDPIPNTFVRLMTLELGENTAKITYPIYSEIAKELARRTYDESGNYTTKPFVLNLVPANRFYLTDIIHSGTTATATCAIPHQLEVGSNILISGALGVDGDFYNGEFTVDSIIDEKVFTYVMSGTPTADAIGTELRLERPDWYTALMNPGKAYIYGFERETISTRAISAERARTIQTVQNYSVSANIGSYVLVDNISGEFDPTSLVNVTLKDTAGGAGTTIGTCKVRHIKYHDGVIGANARWRMYLYDFNFVGASTFADVRSLLNGSNYADVAAGSISNGNAFLLGGEGDLLLTIPQGTVKTLAPGGTNQTSYLTTKSFSAAASGTSVTFNVSGNQSFYGPTGTNFAGTDNHLIYYHAVSSTTGNVLQISDIQISGAGQQLDMTIDESGAQVELVATIQETLKNERTKTPTSTSITIANANISKANPSAELGHADVYAITAVYDSGTVGVAATNGDEDVTSNYKLDTGQRDSFYDFGRVILKNGAPAPKGDILVEYEYYSHSGTGYFSVDSYAGIPYADIPTYTRQRDGLVVQLHDVLDFRPTRTGATTHTGNQMPVPATAVSADYEFYLPRRDRVVMDRDGAMRIVKGVPELNPLLPPEPQFTMTLYELRIPAYVKRPSDIQARYVDNRRYTMRDIGRIDRRVDRLEYYTALSLLEQKVETTPVIDQDGLERFKNGFLVDAYKGHGIGDVRNGDYKCSIDPEMRVVRPPFLPTNAKIDFVNGSNIEHIDDPDYGEFVTLPHTTVSFISNDTASKIENVTPYLVYDHVGSIKCNPASDDWVDTATRPEVMVNLEGDQDAWEFLADAVTEAGIAAGWGTQWNDWETIWTGQEFISTEATFAGAGTLTTTTTTQQVRTGTGISLGFDSVQNSLGDRVVDVNIVPFMRAIDIQVTAEGLRSNRDLHVFFDKEKMNALVTPEAGYEPLTEGSVRTDANGIVKFTLAVPGGQFRTGEREILVLDDPNGVIENSTTRAAYNFPSMGLQQVKQDVVVSTRQPTGSTQAITDERTLVQSVTRVTETVADRDPLAQTFAINSGRYPNGLFLKELDLYFRNKSEGVDPVIIQIRPVVNGYPSSEIWLPMSEIYLYPNDINLPAQTDNIDSIRSAVTTASWPVPIYLEPDKEYAVTLLSVDTNYEVYTSVLGQLEFGSEKVIDKQPVLGSLFKSQNSSTWTAFQNEDLMFNLRRCEFSTAPGTANMRNRDDGTIKPANLFKHNVVALDFGEVAPITWDFTIKDKATQTLSSSLSYQVNRNWKLSSEKELDDAGDFNSLAGLSTTDPSVAPLIDMTRNSLICIQNLVNYYGLLNEGFVITDTGSGYTTATVTITGGGGTGATATAIIDSGAVVGIQIVDEGQNYSSAPTITITGDGSGATAIYEGFESDASQGNAKARYMTRPVTLTEDWETDFVKVTLDIYQPAQTAIEVWYRAKSADDPISITNRPWSKMVQRDETPVISGQERQFTEVVYGPEGGSVAYTADGRTYPTAKVLQFKVVMLSYNTSVVPMASAFRAETAAPA
jgi:hypothetical protein